MIYQEIDFLLPAQRFNIQFSYVSQKGLPFIREFVLRLIHLAPMSKSQISIYFGLSRLETEEAVSDLVQRGELTLSEDGRIMLTNLSQGYFTDLGVTPQLSAVVDSGASLSFDLASFSCFSNQNISDGWRNGVSLRVESENTSQSEKLVEKHFQHQFNQILDKGFLPKSMTQETKERPYVYTVNAVNKLRDFPLRLTTKFKIGMDGTAVERDDFDQLSNSDLVHNLIATQLSEVQRPTNTLAVMQSMLQVGDEETLKVFDPKTNSINPQFIEDLQSLEEHNGSVKATFVGQIYNQENWDRLQTTLAPILVSLIKAKSSDMSGSSFSWIAPSDPFWGKSENLLVAISDLLTKATTKNKNLYKPTLYVPLSGSEDNRTANSWKHELKSYSSSARGLAEGFLDGNVEVLHLVDELVVVIYHFSLPETLPVTMPLGFISTDKATITKVGRLIREYIDGSSSFDRPNDYGYLKSIGGS